MRFAQAHKTASYLMVASAYLALIGGGGVMPLIAFAGLLGLVVSWWWEPPHIRWERWSLAWTISSLVVLAYAVVTGVATGDFLGVGSEFLTYLMLVKAFNRRTARDWQQLYLLAFLMLVAGSVLNMGLTYGACFLGFVITSTWALILFHLRREMEDNFLLKHADDRASERVEVARILSSRRIVGRSFFVGTGVVSLGVFLLSTLIFLAIPRVGVGLFFKGRSGMHFAGFSDGVKLGGHGRIKNDTTVVMRVELDSGDWEGRMAPYIHWRGVAFDRYSKGEWTRTNRAPATQREVDLSTRGKERHYMLYDGDAPQIHVVDGRADGAVRQDIWLEGLDSDVLFGASMPMAFEVDTPLRRQRPRGERNDELRLDRDAGVHYSVWSVLAGPPTADLRAAPTTLPKGYDVYLQLPPEIPARVRALAEEITQGQTTNFDKATAIEAWLHEHLTYTLDLVDPGDHEPVDFFLFDRRQGHCEYFASAMAVLARSVGVPTRNVNGFLGGEWNEYDEYIAVRAGDAHSWVEVYFPGQGWVTFDPTPPDEQDRLGRGGGGTLDRLGRWVDTLRFQWFKWVVDYDLYQQLSLFRDVGATVRGGARAIRDALVAAKGWLRDHLVGLIIVGTAAAIALARWWWRRRQRGEVDADGELVRRRKRSAISAIYAAVLHRLERHGHPRDPGTTPRELADDLVARGVPGAGDLRELTELYYTAEWGGRAGDDDVIRAKALAGAIQAALSAR